MNSLKKIFILVAFSTLIVSKSNSQDIERLNFSETPTTTFQLFSNNEYDGSIKMNNTIHQYGNVPIQYIMTLAARYQIKEKHGIGTNFYSSINRQFNYFRYQAGYSYSIQLGKDFYLSPGIGANLHQIKYKSIYNPDNINDTSSIELGLSDFGFDMDAGITLTKNDFALYFSVGNLLAPQFLYVNTYRTFRFMLLNRFELAGDFGFTPTVYWQSKLITQNPFSLNDINSYFEVDLKFDFKRRFSLAAAYRYKDFLGLRIGGNFKGVTFTYGAMGQLGISTTLPGGNFYHEVSVGYRWNKAPK